MGTREITCCANCFAEVSDSGLCSSCNRQVTLNIPPNALELFVFLQNGRYKIGRVLGVGGFGITYAAFDTFTNTNVAIKEYMPSAFAERRGLEVWGLSERKSDYDEGYSRFKKEWQILSTLTNIKSIVRGLGCFDENRTSYIVMERLTGADVKSLLNETEPQEILYFCDLVIRNIGAALIEVHNKGIIHLDVSPANIFFQSDGSLRLIDFGSSVYMNDASQDTVQLKHGYAPPELYSMKSPKGPWTDVYALAATYYYLVSGIKIPSAEKRLKMDELVPLEKMGLDVPKPVSDCIQKALSLDLNARYRTVREFMCDFVPPPAIEAVQAPGSRKEKKLLRLPKLIRQSGQESRADNRETNRSSAAINKISELLNSIAQKSQSPAFAGPENPVMSPVLVPMLVATSQSYGTINIGLSPGITYKIGRVAGPGFSDLVVTSDTRISKVHLSMRYDGGQRKFFVTDISTNGTFFPDGRRLTRGLEYAINPDETICLGSRECTIKVTMA